MNFSGRFSFSIEGLCNKLILDSHHKPTLQVSSKPYEKTDDVTVSRADLLSYGEIMCNLKSNPVVVNGDLRKSRSIPFAGTLLEISNDRKIYSKKKIPYVIYDSKCIACDGNTAVCSLKVYLLY